MGEAEQSKSMIENLQTQVVEYRERIQIKCAEIAKLFKQNEEYATQITEMRLNDEAAQNNEEELALIIKQRDEMKDHYMALNDKSAIMLLELNELKMKQINMDPANEQPSQSMSDTVSEITNTTTTKNLSEADLYSSLLIEEETEDEKETAMDFDNVMDLVADLKGDLVQQHEDEEEADMHSEEQREMYAYLKRVENIHGQFDSNLLHIVHSKDGMDYCELLE